jgi:hypothetical protein
MRAEYRHRRAALKAEAFEEALSRVSRRVAALARESAARLRKERIELARAAKGSGPGAAPWPWAPVGKHERTAAELAEPSFADGGGEGTVRSKSRICGFDLGLAQLEKSWVSQTVPELSR